MRQYGMKKLPDTFKKDERFKDEATKDARLGAIVRKIVEELNLQEPSESFVEAQLDAIAGAYEEPEEVKAEIRKNKQAFENVKSAAIEAEVVAKVLEKASAGEKVMGFSELVNAQ